MIRTVNAVSARNGFGALLNQVQYRGDRITITRAGKPVAALIDYSLFERISRLDADFARLTDELGGGYRGVDEAVAQAEIDEAVAASRRSGGSFSTPTF